MSHPRTTSGFPSNVSQPVTLHGITYVYNSASQRWETDISRNIDIVTKDTDATYHFSNTLSQTVAHKPNEELLTVPEVDLNFIQLKQGIAGLEKELTWWSQELEEQIDDVSNVVLDSSGNIKFVPLTGGTFTGAVFGLTPATLDNSTQFATTAWVRTRFGNIDTNLISTVSNSFDLGSSTNFWRNIYIGNNIYLKNDLLPDPSVPNDPSLTETLPSGGSRFYKDVNIGSPSLRINHIYAHDISLAGATLTLGEAQVSQTESGGVLLPLNSSVGSDENEIPASFGNTIVDERFAKQSTTSERFTDIFVAQGAISSGDPVKITLLGKATKVTSQSGSEAFLGFAITNASDGQNVEVVLHGLVSGFSNLTVGNLVYIDTSGNIGQTKSSSTQKIGVATVANQIFLFKNSEADIYSLARSKIEYDGLSASVAGPNGNGSLSYNAQTGAFTLTPPDLSPYATISYVDTEIADLLDSAPSTLDTLNELAAALGDDANFATTVTNSLATKAPIASPTFTGTPTAPTPGATSNDTSIATTAFVQNLAGAQSIGDLTDVQLSSTIQDGQVLAYSISSQKFINQNQSGTGGGSTVTFIVDGGTATTVSSDIIIFLDGGGA